MLCSFNNSRIVLDDAILKHSPNIQQILNMEYSEERTYSAIVKTGNWAEVQHLQNIKVEEFFEKKAKEELLIQKREKINQIFLNPIEIDYAINGIVHFGDKVVIKHPGFNTNSNETVNNSLLVAASLGPNPIVNLPLQLPPDAFAVATPIVEANTRTVFIIKSTNDAISVKTPLTFGEQFELWTTDGAGANLRLYSCHRSFVETSKRTTGQVVKLVSQSSQYTKWQVLSLDAAMQLELKGYPVPANTIVAINHVTTNRNLSLEHNVKMTGFQGTEYEVATKTHVDGRRKQLKPNHWLIGMAVLPREVCPKKVDN